MQQLPLKQLIREVLIRSNVIKLIFGHLKEHRFDLMISQIINKLNTFRDIEYNKFELINEITEIIEDILSNCDVDIEYNMCESMSKIVVDVYDEYRHGKTDTYDKIISKHSVSPQSVFEDSEDEIENEENEYISDE
ncbi:hypothetical protein TCON_1079 [Astathelohania contejeani]|uniref:Uncharacterized protein n=1 Tax=Astathelohania contejeani TaxID=164912 RepID=A0ABQ7I006_9MICR|nr:hypothetical protein TCON_1079 [Thelohania contejeani]